jgi:hypothetical protein
VSEQPDWTWRVPNTNVHSIPGGMAGDVVPPLDPQQFQAMFNLLADYFIGQIAIAFGGVEILGWHPFDFLVDWGEDLQAQALAAYLGQETANTKLTDLIDGVLGTGHTFGDLADFITAIPAGVQDFRDALANALGYVGAGFTNANILAFFQEIPGDVVDASVGFLNQGTSLLKFLTPSGGGIGQFDASALTNMLNFPSLGSGWLGTLDGSRLQGALNNALTLQGEVLSNLFNGSAHFIGVLDATATGAINTAITLGGVAVGTLFQHLNSTGLFDASALTNLATGIGSWLTSGGSLPAATTLAVSGLTSLATGVGSWLASGGGLPAATTLAVTGITSLGTGIQAWLGSGGALPGATSLGVGGITGLGTGIGAWLASSGALPGAVTIAATALTSGAIPSGVTMAANYLTGLATGIQTWITSGGALPSATTLAVSGLTSLATGIGTWLSSGGALPGATTLAVSGLTSLATGIGTWLGSGGALPGATTLAATALTSGAIPSGVTMAASYLTGMATGIGSWLTSGGALPGATTLAVSGLTSLATGIQAWLSSGGALPGATTLAVGGLSGLGTGVGAWLAAGGALATGFIPDITLAMSSGMRSLTDGVYNAFNNLSSSNVAISSLVSSVTGFFADFYNKLTGASATAASHTEVTSALDGHVAATGGTAASTAIQQTIIQGLINNGLKVNINFSEYTALPSVLVDVGSTPPAHPDYWAISNHRLIGAANFLYEEPTQGDNQVVSGTWNLGPASQSAIACGSLTCRASADYGAVTGDGLRATYDNSSGAWNLNIYIGGAYSSTPATAVAPFVNGANYALQAGVEEDVEAGIAANPYLYLLRENGSVILEWDDSGHIYPIDSSHRHGGADQDPTTQMLSFSLHDNSFITGGTPNDSTLIAFGAGVNQIVLEDTTDYRALQFLDVSEGQLEVPATSSVEITSYKDAADNDYKKAGVAFSRGTNLGISSSSYATIGGAPSVAVTPGRSGQCRVGLYMKANPNPSSGRTCGMTIAATGGKTITPGSFQSDDYEIYVSNGSAASNFGTGVGAVRIVDGCVPGVPVTFSAQFANNSSGTITFGLTELWAEPV